MSPRLVSIGVIGESRDRPGLEEFAGGAVVAQVINGHRGRADIECVKRLGLNHLQILSMVARCWVATPARKVGSFQMIVLF